MFLSEFCSLSWEPKFIDYLFIQNNKDNVTIFVHNFINNHGLSLCFLCDITTRNNCPIPTISKQTHAHVNGNDLNM